LSPITDSFIGKTYFSIRYHKHHIPFQIALNRQMSISDYDSHGSGVHDLIFSDSDITIKHEDRFVGNFCYF